MATHLSPVPLRPSRMRDWGGKGSRSMISCRQAGRRAGRRAGGWVGGQGH